MTFPAWDTFDGDRRVKGRHIKVYRWCRSFLDFREIRYAPRETVSMYTGVDQADITRVLNALVAWGYLVEHERDADGARRFTLTWSRGGGKTPPPRTPTDATIGA